MNLPRLLTLAAVFSGFMSVSVQAASNGSYLCRNASNFPGGEVIEVKVSTRKEWPALTVVAFLKHEATEGEDFQPAKTHISTDAKGIVAKGYESSLFPAAKITINLTEQTSKSIGSKLLGSDVKLSPQVNPAILTVKRGFTE